MNIIELLTELDGNGLVVTDTDAVNSYLSACNISLTDDLPEAPPALPGDFYDDDLIDWEDDSTDYFWDNDLGDWEVDDDGDFPLTEEN